MHPQREAVMRVLVVKMSSLGDVVHTLAAVTDALRADPAIEFHWVIEEGYDEIPRWHPGVQRVIPVALRRWRRSPWSLIRDNEWFQFRGELRRDRYDVVLDAQGLMKSGWIGLQARGRLAGRSRGTAREPLAAAFYKRRYEVDLMLPEVEQLRQLFALALGYPVPKTPADFGIDRARVIGGGPEPGTLERTAILVHGAAWRSKLWAAENWKRVAQELVEHDWKVKLPWGTSEEKLRAEAIAEASRGEVLPKSSIPQLARELAAARLVVGLDTGLTHIGIALGIPTVTLYGPSVPVYGEVAGGRVVHLRSSESHVVDTGRANTISIEAVIRAIDSIT